MAQPIKIYLAGRITRDRERFGVLDSVNREGDYCDPSHDRMPYPGATPITDAIWYTGPYTVSDDHGCTHRRPDYETHRSAKLPGFGTRNHGAGFGCQGGEYLEWRNRRLAVFQNSIEGVKACDEFFAYIEDEECYGTLVEIGYAAAAGKPITIASPEHFDRQGELWFAGMAAQHVLTGTAEDCAKEFMQQCLERRVLAA